jgi:formylglycine-generating enzyme required for sulfatase activity
MPFSNKKHRWIRRKLGPDDSIKKQKPKVKLPPNIQDDNNEIISVDDNEIEVPSPKLPGIGVAEETVDDIKKSEDVSKKQDGEKTGTSQEDDIIKDQTDEDPNTEKTNSGDNNEKNELDDSEIGISRGGINPPKGHTVENDGKSNEGVGIHDQSAYGIRSSFLSNADINRIKFAVNNDINATVKHEVSQIEKKIENERKYYSRFNWWKFLCCFVIIGLLLWILYCMYNGCRDNNQVVSPVTNHYITKNIYVEKNCTKKQKGQDIEKLKGLFKARVLTETVEPDLIKIPDGKVQYNDIDGNPKSVYVDSFEVMKNEISIKDFFYFANDTEQYPAFWDNGKDDIRKNKNSSYKFSCLDNEQCPIVGISVQDAINYVKWLNVRVNDSSYSLMTEAQWHRFAEYTDINQEVWYLKNSKGKAHEIQTKQPNKYGIHDSYGNVAEICVSTNGMYIAVGGAWSSSEKELSKKYIVDMLEKNNWMGFRLVKSEKKDQK